MGAFPSYLLPKNGERSPLTLSLLGRGLGEGVEVSIMNIIDLRSDTVTHPTSEMRQAMAEAEVGDDVWGDDPTVIRLEGMAAERLGKEAALFCASGTMSNLVAVLAHCTRGDEMIVGDRAHMFLNEAGSASALAGVHVRTVPNDDRGMLEPARIEAAIRGVNIHYPRTRLVCLENTHNQCGGAVLTPEETASMAQVARRQGIPVHLDGARIFNAAVYLRVPASQLTQEVDSVCFCISKGLSAPVGSLLAGSKEFIVEARRWRQAVGGGMRQAGIIAAAGIVALERMVERLEEDHQNAYRLAKGLAELPGVMLDPERVQTNIVFFEVPGVPLPGLVQRLAEEGVKVWSGEGRMRMVTHHGITEEDVDQAVAVVGEAVKRASDL